MAVPYELFEIINDLLDDVDLYHHLVYDLHYNNEFSEFSTSKGRKNYDRIIKRLASVEMPDPEDVIKKSMNIDEFKEYLEEVLLFILGDEYKEDIKIAKAFISPKPYSQITDVRTPYKNIAGIETATEFIISKKHNPIQLANVVNSEITVLLKPLYKDFNNTIGNIHYQKLPGIIATYIAIYKLSKMLKQEKLITDYEDYYIHNDVKYSNGRDKEIINALPEYRRKGVTEHNDHNKFSYIISDIYTTSLVESFLSDEASFLSKYKEMLKGNISIPEYLAYYGINITSPSVIDKYNTQVDEVEKRYRLK